MPGMGGPWLPPELLFLGMGGQFTWAQSLSPSGCTQVFVIQGPDCFCLLSSQLLQRQGAQLLAQTLSRAYFRQWKQQVGASKKPLPLPTASQAHV